MEYKVDRKYQQEFCDALDELGFDGYGMSHDGGYGFENDVFIIRPYYWGECDHKQSLPNFEYKPAGFKLSWYKYALRNSYMNQNIDFKTVIGWIYNECSKSMGIKYSPEDYYIDKLLDLVFEFRDDESLCNKDCENCKLKHKLKLADEHMSLCHIFACLCNDEDKLT